VELGLSTIGIPVTGVVLGDLAVRVEAAGFDSIWTAEAWGADAFTPLAYMAAKTTTLKLGTAIAQMSSRSPAVTGMTALTLQQLSGGRLVLGLGVSGPQVIEGWHGVAFRKPLAMSRDYIAILRKVLAADAKVVHDGEILSVPYAGADATGLGKPLRSTLTPAPQTPILVAALGPKNTAQAAELADGLLPYLFSPRHWQKVWGEAVAAAAPGFQVAPTVLAALGDDLGACRDEVRPSIALHVGAMGSKDQNFYATLVKRYGYDAEAELIQDLYLAGHRKEAIAAVPDALVDDLALVGPPGHVKEQLSIWRECPIATLIVEPTRLDAIEQIAALF